MRWLYEKRYTINIILLLVGVGIVIFYTFCGDACTYIQGSMFGVDLQYLGMAYVAVLVLFNILKRDIVILLLLSAGMGAEIFLVGYQVFHNTYCPYCLIFAAIVFILFLLNMDLSKKLIVAFFMFLGLLGLFVFFKGSAFPTYTGTIVPIVSSVSAIASV